MREYFKIGKLVATYGFKGDMILKHDLGKKTAFKDLKSFFIEEKRDVFIPVFIQSVKVKSPSENYLKLEGIDTKEKGHNFLQKEIWLLENDFKKLAAAKAPISLIGYSIINNDIALGDIMEVIEQPHQLLCKIIINVKEVLIPIHEDFVKKIDKKKKQITVDLPDGLLEIYS
ncbi:MAG: ribosome maturation factor RimM [Ginsengibacter sp.]